MIALVGAVALALPAAASGATIAPDTFLDDNTVNGNCTLREAIIAANTDAAVDACPAGTGADEIPLQPGTYERSVAGAAEDAAATGDLDITDPDGLAIVGSPSGSTVDAKGIDRVFHTRAAAVTRFDLLTITGGNAVGMGVMGGAIDVAEGSNTNVVNSTITGNKAEGEAGGIEVHNLGTRLDLTASTLTGNTSTTQEGGALEYDNNSTVNVTNATFSGNTAANAGGAIESEGGTGTFLNVTVTNNSAPTAGGIYLSQADGQVNLKGTILAGNSATGAGPDCVTLTATPVTSQGNNLIGSTAGCTITVQPSDLTGVDPMLEPLADNGGPTQTHALRPGSPAIDAGPPDAPPVDQRGAPRDAPDIGAYELVVGCQAAIVNRVGSAGDDNLTGTESGDTFLLLAGNDTAAGLGGGDVFCGAEGNDAMSGDAGNDLFDGGDGDDAANGGEGEDIAFGFAGNDAMSGEAGNDRFDGGTGDDAATGGEGDDATLGGGGNDAMSGEAGNDHFDGGPDDDVGTGGDGDDTALGLEGNDKWSGDAGNDRFNGGDGDDVATGGLGDDRLKGLAGKDKLRGLGGKDRLNGGLGKDKLSGGKSKDRLRGAKGKDGLRGNGGADKINSVDASADTVNCGGGDDRATVDPKDEVAKNCETVREVRR